MKVTFEIDDEDLRHFRQELRRAQQSVRAADIEDIIEATRDVVDLVKKSRAPKFVKKRMPRLESLIGIVEDQEWRPPAPVRRRVIEALAYFSDPDDMIPDNVPGLGFLDDAILIELVFRELRHDIEAYEDFARYRAAAQRGLEKKNSDPDLRKLLAGKRKTLNARIKRRRERDRAATKGRQRARLW